MDATIAALLPTLTAAAATLNNNLSITTAASTDPSESNLPSTVNTLSDNDLKRSWLSLLPVEQIVSIVLRLEEYAPPNVKSEIWPSDLGAAVRSLSGYDKGKGKETENSLENGASAVQKQTSGPPDGPESPTTDVEETPATRVTEAPANSVSTSTPASSTALSVPVLPGIPVVHPAPASSSPSSLPVPPLAPPPPGVTTGIPTGPTGHLPYPFTAYPSYAGANSPFPYPLPHPPTGGQAQLLSSPGTSPPEQSSPHPPPPPPPPHLFPFGPLGLPPPPPGVHPHPPLNNGPFTRAPLPPPHLKAASNRGNFPTFPPHPDPKSLQAEDLPSYEEMIVQALIELGATDPVVAGDGAVPKQLFQWMAQRYPLQQNFRPSASQALQKAYKRGRFEKNKDGRYRLNIRWEGGNTSKRTTRRPQSQTQAGINPHPSSHPPPNGHPYPRYGWYPPPGEIGVPPVNGQAPTTSPANPSVSEAGTGQPEGPTPDQNHDPESAREAWEAAQSILQALNITALLQQAKAQAAAEAAAAAGSDTQNGMEGTARSPLSGDSAAPKSASTQSTAAPSGVLFPPPIFAGDISLGSANANSDSGGLSLPSTSTTSSNAQPQSQQFFSNPLLPQETSLSSTGATSGASPVIDPALSPGPSLSRAALQGNLALLAAQLADIAGVEDEEDPVSRSVSASSKSVSAHSAVAEGLTGLEALLGINWSASLKAPIVPR